ncbi:AfsR/SARP family transcriptional regulator [Kribbella karoonensis]|uniref:AfsR/SARP family transcriptional regulator n=1 Tax=Kribbella karoonensis TaxID=324851 RepID=UPI0031D9113C
MRFRILGSVGVVAGQSELVIPGERVRTLLAALLLRADQVVPAEQLLYDVWGEDLPANPRSAMQAAVSRLRQATGAEVQHAYGGYRIALDGHELDLTQFRDRVASASAADAEERLDLLTAALRLHQGDVLRGASTGTLARRFGPGLRDEWLDVREQRAEALLLLGQVDGAAAELVALTNDSPLRERAWLFLLQALQAAGRTAEALAAYEKVRQLLADELGADPSPELRDLHQQLLDSERAAAWTARTRLPLPVTGFIGREDETTKTLDLLSDDDGLPVVVLSGLPGVGKSALATRIAHAAKPRFPDGQWFVRLRSRSVDAVLVELLGYCGISSDAVPDDPRGRADTYRELLSGRRVLLVLDDATSAAEVEAVLPNHAGCAVIVTSRSSLGELAVTAGASSVAVEVLTADEAAGFLRKTVRSTDDGALWELAGLCAGLPLALRIAAAAARTLPAAQLTSYVDRLRTDRLGRLSRSVGDQGVRESFDLSYGALPAQLRRLFGVLALHPGDDFGPGVAAALLGAGTPVAAVGLDQLAAANLLIRVGVDRYRFHDLVREYAQGLEVTGREQAAHRMLDWYLVSGLNARRVLYAGGAERYVGAIDPVVEPARPTSELDGYDWFDTEWDNLVAAIYWAGTHGHSNRCWQLAGTTWPYISHRRRWQDHRALYLFAIERARAERRPDGEALMLGWLGSAQIYARDRAAASATFAEMRRLSRAIADRSAEAIAVRGSALVLHWQNDAAAALALYRETLELHDQLIGRAESLNNIADCLYRLGDLEAARSAAVQAIRTYESVNSRHGIAIANGTLAEICLVQGDLEAAERLISSSLAIVRELGAVVLEAEGTAVLALIHESAQRQDLARKTARQAADLLQDAGANVFVARIAHLLP